MKAGDAKLTGNITVLPPRSSNAHVGSDLTAFLSCVPMRHQQIHYVNSVGGKRLGEKRVPGKLQCLVAEVSWEEGRRWYSFQPRGIKRGSEDSGVKFLSERA